MTTKKDNQKPGLINSFLKYFQSEVVDIQSDKHLPIALLHHHFAKGTRIERTRLEFQQKFFALVWSCYRRNFSPLLLTDLDSLERMFMVRDFDRQIKIGMTTDVGWGCTIRVFQMLLCNSVLKLHLGDYQMKDLCNSKVYP